MNPDWVIGGGGLLGSAIRRAVTHTWATRVRWDDADTAEADLRHAVDAFVAQPGPLRIYWCAGKGVTATPAAELAREITTFHAFLDALRGQDAARTTVFLASSVGGAYAAASAPPFTERTSARAASAYGEAKLDMERSLSAWTESTGGRAVIGRITNLYGPGQDVSKAQGLISVALRSYLTGAPATIFVSLDTLRDYLFVDDGAAIAVAATRRAEAGVAGCATLKILGYGTAVSVGAVLGEIARLRRTRAPIVLAGGGQGGQAPDLRVRSTIWTDLDALATTTLPAGIQRTYDRMLRDFACGTARTPTGP